MFDADAGSQAAKYPVATSAQVETAIAYFRKADARDPTVVDLFTDDVELYFPKLGRVRGKEGFVQFAGKLAAEMSRLEHDVDGFRLLQSGETVVIEGTERGVTRQGAAWPDGVVSEGRFCNVFEFDGTLIRRLYVYVDPDFTSRDHQRIAELRSDTLQTSQSVTDASVNGRAPAASSARAPDVSPEPTRAPAGGRSAGVREDVAATISAGQTSGESPHGDARQVEQVLARYVRAADTRDGAAMASLFVADGRVEIYYNHAGQPEPIGELVGADAIADAVARMLPPHPTRGWSHHMTADHLVEVVGDVATMDAQFVRFTVVGAARPATGWPPGAAGMQGSVRADESGYYRATLRRVHGVWKIVTQQVIQDMPWASPEA